MPEFGENVGSYQWIIKKKFSNQDFGKIWLIKILNPKTLKDIKYTCVYD